MKKVSLIMIILWSIIGLIIAFALVTGIFFNWRGGADFGFDEQNTELVVDESVSANGLDTIKIDLAADACRILLTDGDNINVKHYARGIEKGRYASLTTNQTGALTISTQRGYNNGFNIFNFIAMNNYSMVEVYLPKSYGQSLDIDINSGTLAIEDALDLSGLGIKVSSGTIRTDGQIKAPQTHISVNSGTVRLSEGIEADEYSIKVSSGTVIADRLKGSGGIEVNSGTIRLSGVDIKDFLNVKVSSGTINIGITGNPALKFTGYKNSGTLRTYFGSYYSEDGRQVTATVGEEPYKSLDVSVNSGTINITQD